MLFHADLPLYRVNESAGQHPAAVAWLTERQDGPRRVRLPWRRIGAFLRIATHPRAFERPRAPSVAWERFADWLAALADWIRSPTTW